MLRVITHPLFMAVVAWLLAANAIRIAMRLEQGVNHRWWMDVMLVAASLFGVAAAWYYSIAQRPDTATEPDASLVISALAISPMVIGVAGVVFGGSAWASWFTALAMACGLAAWVHHERRRRRQSDS